jgi:hypothetical protein
MFLTSNALAEKINYKCFFPSGSPFPDQFSIDTTRKMVDKFPFEKGSTDTIVKIASFFDTEKKGVLMGMFYTIDLLDDTVLVQKVMEINRLQQIIGRDDPFKMIPPDTMEVLLNCERSGAKSSETEAVLTDRSLIEPNYYCKAKQFGAGYSKLLNIEILPNDNFSLEYIWKLDEGESTPVRYHATFDRGQLMWFDLIKGTDTSTGKPNLYSYQLLQEKNQKREFRILAYIISQNEYDNLKPLYDQIMFFDGSDESIKLEEKFYEEAIKSFNKIQGETSEFEYGFQYDCDTNPESILVAQEENVPESSLPIYDLTAFEKKYLEEKGYNLDSNSEYFETDFSNAMTTFGWNYIEGLDGFDQNNEKAILWNTRASEWGHSTASSNLGLFYYAGLVGLKQDLKLAHKYYVLAAEQWDTSPHEPEAIVEEMNKYNPNPTKEFENLRDLFLAATKLRSEKRMNRLRDLVDLSQVKDEKVTVQDFIKRGLIYCTGNNKISIHRLLSENTLLLKDLDTTGWDITEEQKIKNLRFARYNNEKVEWFEIVDAIVGIIEPVLWRYEVYFDQKKHKQLVFQSESYFTTEKQYMKLRGPQSIATKEKLSGMGGPKHIRYENIFFDEASKMFKKLSKISKDNIKETHTCE